MKRGWFKKAKKKWLSKRLYSFRFYHAKDLFYTDYDLKRSRLGKNLLTYRYMSTDTEQMIRHIRDLSFKASYIFCRRLCLRNEGRYTLRTDKVKRFN